MESDPVVEEDPTAPKVLPLGYYRPPPRHRSSSLRRTLSHWTGRAVVYSIILLPLLFLLITTFLIRW